MLNSKSIYNTIAFILLLAYSSDVLSQTHRAKEDLVALENVEINSIDRLPIYWNLVEEYIWINRDSSVYFARKGFELAKKMGTKEDQAAFNERMSYAYVTSERLDSFQYYGEEGLRLYTELGNEKGLALSHLALGYGKRMKGDRESAQNHFLEALRIGESLKDYRVIGDANYHIMSLFFFQEQQPHSIENGLKAIDAYEKIGDDLHLGKTYQFLGNVHRRIPDYDEAKNTMN